MLALRPRRWNSTVYGKPRASFFWLTLAMIGDTRTSNTTSSNVGVAGSCGYGYSSQIRPDGVAGLVSPVCQMPAAPGAWKRSAALPSGMAVWKPQAPDLVYSHMLVGPMPIPTLLSGWRRPSQPPLLRSKSNGTLWSGSAGVVEFRMPRSSAPFGMMSPSPGSVLVPLLLRSSPSVLLTKPLTLLGTNMVEKVMSSS